MDSRASLFLDSKYNNFLTSSYKLQTSLVKDLPNPLRIYIQSMRASIHINNVNVNNHIIYCESSVSGLYQLDIPYGQYGLAEFGQALEEVMNAKLAPAVFVVTANALTYTLNITCATTFRFIVQSGTMSDHVQFATWPTSWGTDQDVEDCFLFYTRYIALNSKTLSEGNLGIVSNNNGISSSLIVMPLSNPSLNFIQYILPSDTQLYLNRYKPVALSNFDAVLIDEFGTELSTYCYNPADYFTLTCLVDY